MRLICTLIALVIFSTAGRTQTTEDMAVELNATTQTTPPVITLHWKKVAFGAPTYKVWKKSKTATSFGTAVATLTATDSTWADTAVIADSAYEYCVYGFGTIAPAGYIYAGIKSPAIHNRGILILVVDSTFSDSCAAGIKRLMNDLSGDGWQIIRHDFARTVLDTVIKAKIKNDYTTHTNVKAVLLLGHVAVPYSGDLNPDGHPDHRGAWPADVYYASMTGTWTDASINDTVAGYALNKNIPGDGKWDQTIIPGTVQLQVSRIDFNNMPAFPGTEVQLMTSYLNKDHLYKMDSLPVIHRALVDDQFGYFGGEAFAANGFRNFPPLVGKDSMRVLPYISTLASSSYQWAYGTGPGSFTSAGGIGVTTDFVTNPVNGIFSMLFGSYFGDWNAQNDLLRAPLCANPPMLTNCWAGRPNWFFHHMALGENIGYSTQLTQNNTSLYQPANSGAGWVHVALMGDLSLRTDYIKPPLSLTITKPYHSGAMLNWTASPDAGVIGYHVYRADSQYGYFQRITATMLTAATTTYHDISSATSGLKYYMVRPVKLQSTPSGGYYNLGVGVMDTASIISVIQVAEVAPAVSLSVFPNPTQNNLNVTVNSASACPVTLYIVDLQGRVSAMAVKQLNPGNNTYSLNVASYAPGNYTVVVQTGDSRTAQKWTKL